jgi:hypothetical protein
MPLRVEENESPNPGNIGLFSPVAVVADPELGLDVVEEHKGDLLLPDAGTLPTQLPYTYRGRRQFIADLLEKKSEKSATSRREPHVNRFSLSAACA